MKQLQQCTINSRKFTALNVQCTCVDLIIIDVTNKTCQIKFKMKEIIAEGSSDEEDDDESSDDEWMDNQEKVPMF